MIIEPMNEVSTDERKLSCGESWQPEVEYLTKDNEEAEDGSLENGSLDDEKDEESPGPLIVTGCIVAGRTSKLEPRQVESTGPWPSS